MTTTPADRRPDDAELERLRASVEAPGRRTMSRREALGWNRRWSTEDVELLTRHVDRVGAVRFNRTGDDHYIRCIDAQDRTIMVIAWGYVHFARPWANAECDPEWQGIALSTWAARQPPAPVATKPAASRTPRVPRTPPRAEQAPTFCPRCFLQVTTTGVCGNCD